MIVRIPKTFYDDHVVQRDLPAPPTIKETKSHYWIDTDHEDMAELLSDAQHYASPDGPDADTRWIKTAATALLKAVAP
jgi:hypothetical protein